MPLKPSKFAKTNMERLQVRRASTSALRKLIGIQAIRCEGYTMTVISADCTCYASKVNLKAGMVTLGWAVGSLKPALITELMSL
jgi:hypothetical protein